MKDTPIAPYDARAIANLILDFADEAKVSVTQLSLLKTLYFAHGWYLAKTGRPLIIQPVESWKYGPVIKVVRDAFKESGSLPITSRADRLDLRTGEFVKVSPLLNELDKSFVNDIFRAYCVLGAWTLSDMTHEEGTPWDKVWNAKGAVGRFGLRLRNEDIKRYFSTASMPQHLN